MPTTLAEAVQAISKVAKNVALKRFPVKFSQIVKEEAMFEQRMLVPGRPVAAGELQRGPTAFSGQIENTEKNEQKHQSIAGETVSDYLCHEGGGEVRRQRRARRHQPDQESRHRARGTAQVFLKVFWFLSPQSPNPPQSSFHSL